MPYGYPEVLFESEKLIKGLADRNITPELIRSDELAMEAMRTGQVSQDFMRSRAGLPFYMSYTAPTDETSAIGFERNFNP